ncbi:MAG: ParA family protein, partial [Bacteroidota bacterium]
MKTYALYHLKGGVGKTTSAVNLAYLAAKEGHKTLHWDTDQQEIVENTSDSSHESPSRMPT